MLTKRTHRVGMTAHARLLDDLLTQGPVRRRDHPELAGALGWRLRTGEITAVLPGVYVPTSRADDRDLLLTAATVWDSGVVVIGRAAAALQFWPELAVPTIDLAVPTQRRAAPSRYRLTERLIPGNWVNRASGHPCTHPALTAIDLCAELGAEAVERALRSRQVKPTHLDSALAAFPQRTGNGRRRELVVRAAANPWSWAEAETHHLLRRAGVGGWVGNPPLRVRGRLYYPDILFRSLRLVVEIDGFQHRTDKEVFENDLQRQNDFVLDNYEVLRYSTDSVRLRPRAMVAEIREKVAALTANPHFVRPAAPQWDRQPR